MTDLVPVEDISPATQKSIEDHPAIEAIYDFIRLGRATVDDVTVDRQADLVRVLNEKHPEHKLYSTYITRLRKRIKRADGGYMLKDGRVCYADGTPVYNVPLRETLEAFIQIGLENALAHPETVQARDVMKAIDMWVRVHKGFGDANQYADAWTEVVKDGPKKKAPRQKVVRVIEAKEKDDDVELVEFDENGNVKGSMYQPLNRDGEDESLMALKAKAEE